MLEIWNIGQKTYLRTQRAVSSEMEIVMEKGLEKYILGEKKKFRRPNV